MVNDVDPDSQPLPRDRGGAWRAYSAEQYRRLADPQKPWLEWLKKNPGGAWSDFLNENPQDAEEIRRATTAWDSSPPEHIALEGADLRMACLSRSGLSLDLRGARLSKAQLDGAQLQRASLEGARIQDASIRGARLSGARLEGADLRGSDLRDSSLVNAHLNGARLSWTRLEGVDLRRADLTNADFHEAVMDRTQLDQVVFGPDHQSMHDGSEAIIFPRRDRTLNWGGIRRVGTLPLFEISYVALAASLLAITTVGYVNEARLFDVDYPVPLPARMMWLLLSSLLLVIGTTMYRLACPPRVQEFSETQWVEQHGRPRLQYLAESLKRRWQIPTAVFTGIGGVLGVALLLERIWVAFRYVIQELLR